MTDQTNDSTAQRIYEAEKIIPELGRILRTYLRRRFVTLDDVKNKLWESQPSPSVALPNVNTRRKMLVAGLKSLDHSPFKKITFVEFASQVIPKTVKMDVWIEPYLGMYGALVTSCDPAVRLLKWDFEHARNQVSYYDHTNGGHPDDWGLEIACWTPVLLVTKLPHMWGPNDFEELERGAMFVLEGCRDKYGIGTAIFKKILNNTWSHIGDALEELSHQMSLEVPEGPLASGVIVKDGHTVQVRAIVHSDDGGTEEEIYNIVSFD